MGSVLRIPTYRLIATVFVVAGMIIASVQYWLPRYLTDQFGLSLAQSGLKATIWIQSATAVGLLLGGRTHGPGNGCRDEPWSNWSDWPF